jgi:hypothetical protein
MTDHSSMKGRRPRTESPRAILDRRFANGELNAKQYAEARWLLESRFLPH